MERSRNSAGSLTPLPFADRTAGAMTVLRLISRLSAALESDAVDYCHWKSNHRLDRSAAGDTDLDLLIRRDHADRFLQILHRLEFKQAEAPPGQRMEGVKDYYGFDEDSGKIVHVHAHYRLVVGDDRTKNYLLPLESVFLRSALPASPLRVPELELEFAVFVVRMILKYSSWEILLRRRWDMPEKEREELRYLRARAEGSRVSEILERHFAFLDPRLFQDCLESLSKDRSGWSRIRVGRRLRRALTPFARRSRIADGFLKAWRRVELAARRRMPRLRRRRRLSTGGAMIAIVGGDGAGKTTVVNETYRWLSADFDVVHVHLGKPPWSSTTRLVRGLLKLGRLGNLVPYVRTASVRYLPEGAEPVFPGYPVLLRELCASRDRHLAHGRARRFANRGGIVICDRFPLPRIRLMDGPQLEHLVPQDRWTPLLRLMNRIEQSYYRSISPPDGLVLLRVHPEIAVRRRADEDPVPVRARSREIWELPADDIGATVIDSSLPRDEVMAIARSYLWSVL